jgi:hypothetical protein
MPHTGGVVFFQVPPAQVKSQHFARHQTHNGRPCIAERGTAIVEKRSILLAQSNRPKSNSLDPVGRWKHGAENIGIGSRIPNGVSDDENRMIATLRTVDVKF